MTLKTSSFFLFLFFSFSLVRRKANTNSIDEYRKYRYVIDWLPKRYSHADLYRRALKGLKVYLLTIRRSQAVYNCNGTNDRDPFSRSQGNLKIEKKKVMLPLHPPFFVCFCFCFLRVGCLGGQGLCVCVCVCVRAPSPPPPPLLCVCVCVCVVFSGGGEGGGVVCVCVFPEF